MFVSHYVWRGHTAHNLYTLSDNCVFSSPCWLSRFCVYSYFVIMFRLVKFKYIYIDVVVVMLLLLDLNDFYPNVFSQLNQFHFSVFATNHNNNNKKILFSIIRSCLKYHFEKPAIANCTVGLIHKSKQLLYVLSHCKYLKNRLVNRKFNRFFFYIWYNYSLNRFLSAFFGYSSRFESFVFYCLYPFGKFWLFVKSILQSLRIRAMWNDRRSLSNGKTYDF